MEHNVSYEERTLMSLYNSGGTREALIVELTQMRRYIETDEGDLRELTDSAIRKLRAMTDEEYEGLDLFPDFSPEDEDAG